MAVVRDFFSDVPFVQPLLDPHLRFTQVMSVGSHQKADAFDVSVGKCEEYLENGVIIRPRETAELGTPCIPDNPASPPWSPNGAGLSHEPKACSAVPLDQYRKLRAAFRAGA
jgi:hypothetical protein